MWKSPVALPNLGVRPPCPSNDEEDAQEHHKEDEGPLFRVALGATAHKPQAHCYKKIQVVMLSGLSGSRAEQKLWQAAEAKVLSGLYGCALCPKWSEWVPHF
mmetsp:Transcript_59140/g.117158  ORF Transcript_59140/g.117158 Transcript_59140/m.117158 type:complete len:102 (-) Transcript_59140:9-314(-)